MLAPMRPLNPTSLGQLSGDDMAKSATSNWPSRDDHFADGQSPQQTLDASCFTFVNVGFRAKIWVVATTATGRKFELTRMQWLYCRPNRHLYCNAIELIFEMAGKVSSLFPVDDRIEVFTCFPHAGKKSLRFEPHKPRAANEHCNGHLCRAPCALR